MRDRNCDRNLAIDGGWDRICRRFAAVVDHGTLILSTWSNCKKGLNENSRYASRKRANDIRRVETFMSVQSSKSRPHALAAAVLAVLSLQVVDARAADGPFTSLEGNWTGSGTITMKSGTRERIRCRATYAVSPAGNAINQRLLCASDSYRFNVVSDETEQGGVIGGGWSETTRNASGSVSGRIDGSVIRATVTGVGFTADLSLVTRGRTQAVSIRPSGGTDVVDVTVNLRRE